MLKTTAELEKMANILRLDIIKMVGVGQKGHLGGSCSLNVAAFHNGELTAEQFEKACKELNK